MRPSSTATRPLREPALGLALPHQLHARRADHDRREGVVGLERGQRLHGLAEPLLVGDERAAARRGRSARRRAGRDAARRRGPRPSARRPRHMRAPPSRSRGRARSVSSSSSSAARSSTWTCGWLLHERGELRASAGSPGPPRPRAHRGRRSGRSAGTGRASGRRRKSCRRLGVPAGVDGQLRLAVVADLERELGRRAASAASSSSRALARARSSSARPRCPATAAREAGAERDHEPALADRPRSRAARLLGRLARDGAQHERPGARRGRPRTRAPASDPSRSARRAPRAWARAAGSARARSATSFAEARIGGHAPVLAPPVEPAPGQPADRLVQLLVEREVEDDLRVSRGCPRAARRGPSAPPPRSWIDSGTNLRD